MVYSADSESVTVIVGVCSMEGFGLYSVNAIHGDRIGNELFDSVFQSPLYGLELVDYSVQSATGSLLEMASLLESAIWCYFACLVSGYVRRMVLRSYSC